MPESRDQRRSDFLQIAKSLMGEDGSALSVTPEMLARAARTEPSAFHECFADLREFQLYLLEHLLNEIRDGVILKIRLLPSGFKKLKTGFETYLDANLKCRPLRELANHYRSDLEGARLLRARVDCVSVFLTLELRAMGAVAIRAEAHEMASKAVEIAHAEFEAHCKLPAHRKALFQYLQECAGRPHQWRPGVEAGQAFAFS